MPKQARAVVATGVDHDLAVDDIDLVDLAGDEVLVRIAATGICHTDLSVANGVIPFGFPVVLGHEAAGVVEEVGPAARRFRPGDRVVVAVTSHCGHCRFCETGYHPLCVDRSGHRERYTWRAAPIYQGFGTGTFTTHTVLREASLAPVPDGVALEVAAVTGCAVATGMGAVLKDAKVRPGSTVAVIGCGGVGTSAVMASLVSGAARVVAVDPNPQRRALAIAAGATDAVEPSLDALRELEENGFDYVFESAGRIDAMALAVAATGFTGTTVLMGLPSPLETLALPVFELINRCKTIVGCNMGRLSPNVDFPAYFRLYLAGRLPLDALVGATVPIEEAARGFQLAHEGSTLRVLLTTGETS